MAYTYQAPKDIDAQSAAFKAKFPTLEELYARGTYEVQPKYDGVFSASYTGKHTLSRQGELQPSAGHILEEVTDRLKENFIVFKELWIPGEKHKTINGLARKQSLQPKLRGAVFDCITVEEFQAGKSKMPYHERKQLLADKLSGCETVFVAESLQVEPDGKDYFVKLASEMKAHESNAYDGVILRNTQGLWLPGAVKQGEVLRVKPGMTFDLLCVGQSAEQRATKLGGFVTVELNGVKTDVGSGLNQAQLRGIIDGSIDFTGKILEIECLGVTPAGRLREPRLKSVRHDTKREEDK